MSLMKKLKDILFEEEDDETVPIKINDESKVSEKKSVNSEPVELKRTFNTKNDIEVDFDYDSLKENSQIKEETNSSPSERDLFTKENSFKFPLFDEEEFKTSVSRSTVNNNALEFERKKSVEKRNEYRGYEREPRQEERKKFTPSPIISPVYGILNQDYKADDIIKKEDNSNINIDEVRKKAFEVNDDVIPEALDIAITPDINEIVKENVSDIPKVNDSIDEPVVTFFDEKKDDKEDDNYKTVGDLLESASEEISLEDTLEIPKQNNLDAIEEELEKIDEEVKDNNKDLDDTLDSDLFELIDSMYDEREEGN